MVKNLVTFIDGTTTIIESNMPPTIEAGLIQFYKKTKLYGGNPEYSYVALINIAQIRSLRVLPNSNAESCSKEKKEEK